MYILASKNYGTLYVGVTNDLLERVTQHKSKINSGFTRQYAVDKLVYYEIYGGVEEAILREKKLKKWRREWKIRLIEEDNPEWCDLYFELIQCT